MSLPFLIVFPHFVLSSYLIFLQIMFYDLLNSSIEPINILLYNTQCLHNSQFPFARVSKLFISCLSLPLLIQFITSSRLEWAEKPTPPSHTALVQREEKGGKREPSTKSQHAHAACVLKIDNPPHYFSFLFFSFPSFLVSSNNYCLGCFLNAYFLY
jgi:hypothetical protein